MASALHPYQISKISERSFSFTTSSGSVYYCYFFDFSSAFAPYPDLALNVFGFNLELKDKPTDKKVGLDKRIAATIVTIIRAFFDEKENVVVYICDTSDNLEKARFHKFTNWFRLYNDGSIVQLKGVIRAGGVNILNTMLIHKENVLLNEYIEAYEILTGFYTKPDDEELNNILNEPEW